MPPENEHDEADQAQVVLGPRQVLAHLVLGAAIPAHADELVGERLAQVARRAAPPSSSGHAEQLLERGAAAERQQAGRLEIGAVDDHARAERERADAAPRLGGDDAANLERLRSDQDAVADLQAELRQQLRPDERAATRPAARARRRRRGASTTP